MEHLNLFRTEHDSGIIVSLLSLIPFAVFCGYTIQKISSGNSFGNTLRSFSMLFICIPNLFLSGLVIEFPENKFIIPLALSVATSILYALIITDRLPGKLYTISAALFLSASIVLTRLLIANPFLILFGILFGPALLLLSPISFALQMLHAFLISIRTLRNVSLMQRFVIAAVVLASIIATEVLAKDFIESIN